MKILIVTNHFWPEQFRINDIALGLQERGHQVSVLTGIPNYPCGHFTTGYGLLKKRRETWQGISIVRAPLVPRGSGRGRRLLLNYLSHLVSSSLLALFSCRERCDLVFVFESSPVTVGLPALILKKRYGLPVLFWVQDLWPESLSATGVVRSPRLLGWVEKLVRFIYKGCDHILVQSRGFIPSVRQLAPAGKPVSYFPNSAEASYRPCPADPAVSQGFGLPEGFVVMFAGNLGVAQDFPTVLAAAERLKGQPEIHWVIVGDGRQREWLEGQIAARGLQDQVHLLGSHPLEAMAGLFACADVMLMTLRDEPIFALTVPSKLQSYLACGRPVIAALNGEGARVVEEAGAGRTCPAETPEQLAAAVLELYRLPKPEREAMGARGRDYFLREFDREELLGRLESWMADLAGLRATPGPGLQQSKG